jgi:hypothetical protein
MEARKPGGRASCEIAAHTCLETKTSSTRRSSLADEVATSRYASARSCSCRMRASTMRKYSGQFIVARHLCTSSLHAQARMGAPQPGASAQQTCQRTACGSTTHACECAVKVAGGSRGKQSRYNSAARTRQRRPVQHGRGRASRCMLRRLWLVLRRRGWQGVLTAQAGTHSADLHGLARGEIRMSSRHSAKPDITARRPQDTTSAKHLCFRL